MRNDVKCIRFKAYAFTEWPAKSSLNKDPTINKPYRLCIVGSFAGYGILVTMQKNRNEQLKDEKEKK